MKYVIITLAILSSACATQEKPRGFDMPPALREVFRGGQLKGFEQAESPDLGMPGQYDRVSHVCVSEPIYGIYGEYVRTTVKCW